MDAYIYLVLAYSIVWLGIFGFTWYTNNKANQLQQDMLLLKEMIEAKK
ncbi:MAG: CcmD family protein [Candidatus Marinimicrobia bacterium]|nr:CcmD family protein [Candidatus Neomarinimicrobiota bacterium]MCF7851204.1 CcmD family protein [Candidatus Neomarinimicrobiota bacterium]MCF7904138.1 CcmD family protein [Candidatus Neomarinimicrobiota bacterium]